MLSNKKHIGIVFGPASSGKGTLASRIANKYDYKVIVTGNLIREWISNHEDKSLITQVNNGELIGDEQLKSILFEEFRLLEERHIFDKDIILDGMPRRGSQIKIVEDICNRYDYKISWIITLEVPLEVIIDRAEGRRLASDGTIYHLKYNPPPSHINPDKLIHRDDDTKDVIIKRYKDYYKDTVECLNHPFFNHVNKITIDATSSIDVVFQEAKKFITNIVE